MTMHMTGPILGYWSRLEDNELARRSLLQAPALLVELDGCRPRLARAGRIVGLGPVSSRLVGAIAAASPGVVGYDDLYEHLYGDHADGGADNAINVIRVLACKLRPQLALLGCRMETRWGCGLSLVIGPLVARGTPGRVVSRAVLVEMGAAA